MKKLIAGFMTALMALLPIVSAAELGNYPAFLEDADGTLDALVVIGSAAAVGDVVGAVDIAVRLAEVGKTTTSQTCAGASAAVVGTRKDNLALNADLSSQFPASGVLKTAHYSELDDSTFSFRGTDYDYREQVDFGSVTLSHDLATNNVNGTEKMTVLSGEIKYQLVFEKVLTGTGSATSPNYTYPVNIQMLGQDFAIVGTGGSQVRMLHGSIGTATATTAIVYGDYSVYSDLGSNGAWARVIIKDADGNTVDTLTVNSGDSKQSVATGLTVQITSVRALMDGTVVGTDMVVGPTTEGVTKVYDVTADVTSTGTASDRFPGETEWGIRVASGTFATAGQIAVADMLEVVYKPSSTQYLVAGEKISLPNDYGDLEFEGWNTDKFATITIGPLGGTISAYNNALDTQAFGNLNGLEISSDVAGTLISGKNTGYDKAYVLFNYSRTAQQTPVFIGFYDSSKQKVIVNGTVLGADDAQGASTEFLSKIIDLAATYTDSANATVSYAFKLSYGNAGDQNFYLNVTAAAASVKGSTTKIINTMFAGKSQTVASLSFGYQNWTSVTTTQAPSFRLGTTASSAQAYEVNATTHGTARDASKKAQEIVDDSGILLQDTAAYGGADKVVFKIPFKDLKAVVYFGKKGTGVSGDTVSYTSYPSIPISSAVARLDSELTTSNKAKNLISVGGPCVNSVTAEALGLEYPTCGAASTIPQDKGLISVVDSPYTDGMVVLVVAGWEVDNTRAASSAVQLFDTKLAGITSSAVEVTGTTGAPVVTAV
jgi:hypothetical protein